MTKEEFESRNFTQVKRNNISPALAYSVVSIDWLEGLIETNERRSFGKNTWIRYENADIVTKRYKDKKDD